MEYKSLFTNLFSTSSNNILEPLSCLIRLCMLNYQDDNTKIGIHRNKIFFYRPNLMQGVVRTIFRESRENLHNLHNPISKSVLWYNCRCLEIKYIFKFSILGLRKLKESYYSETIINHSLDRYIDILNKEYQDFESNNLELGSDNSNFLKEINTEQSESDSKYSLYKNLISIWDYRNIQTIYNLLIDLEKSNSYKSSQTYLEALDKVLTMKELEVTRIIIDSSTVL
tara:strand:+ start:3116 stop:3793 length:678 start_codon:yes stop_codon:yes gene_type:complete